MNAIPAFLFFGLTAKREQKDVCALCLVSTFTWGFLCFLSIFVCAFVSLCVHVHILHLNFVKLNYGRYVFFFFISLLVCLSVSSRNLYCMCMSRLIHVANRKVNAHSPVKMLSFDNDIELCRVASLSAIHLSDRQTDRLNTDFVVRDMRNALVWCVHCLRCLNCAVRSPKTY